MIKSYTTSSLETADQVSRAKQELPGGGHETCPVVRGVPARGVGRRGWSSKRVPAGREQATAQGSVRTDQGTHGAATHAVAQPESALSELSEVLRAAESGQLINRLLAG